MKLLAYPLLADENIHADVVSWLRHVGSFTIDTLRAVQTGAIDVEPPFIAVVERRAAETRVRVRRPLAI